MHSSPSLRALALLVAATTLGCPPPAAPPPPPPAPARPRPRPQPSRPAFVTPTPALDSAVLAPAGQPACPVHGTPLGAVGGSTPQAPTLPESDYARSRYPCASGVGDPKQACTVCDHVRARWDPQEECAWRDRTAEAICPVHGVPLVERVATVRYGMPGEDSYARRAQFPCRGVVLGGCDPDDPTPPRPVQVCDVCLRASATWSYGAWIQARDADPVGPASSLAWPGAEPLVVAPTGQLAVGVRRVGPYEFDVVGDGSPQRVVLQPPSLRDQAVVEEAYLCWGGRGGVHPRVFVAGGWLQGALVGQDHHGAKLYVARLEPQARFEELEVHGSWERGGVALVRLATHADLPRSEWLLAWGVDARRERSLLLEPHARAAAVPVSVGCVVARGPLVEGARFQVNDTPLPTRGAQTESRFDVLQDRLEVDTRDGLRLAVADVGDARDASCWLLAAVALPAPPDAGHPPPQAE